MSDYISREDVRKLLWERISLATFMRRGIPNAMKSLSLISEELEKIPAADVRPVVRGRWITEEEAERMDDYSRADTCSVCGHCDWDCTESRWFNFCPYCGADMRETP